MKHIITALVENQPGVLARIVGLISGRGYNIESLNVAPTLDPTVSRMTIQVPGDDRVLEQVTKQLNKIIDVIKVADLTKRQHVTRELVLVKVKVTPEKRVEIAKFAELNNGCIAHVSPKSMTVQMSGDQNEIQNFLELMKPFQITDISRSGAIAMGKEEG